MGCDGLVSALVVAVAFPWKARVRLINSERQRRKVNILLGFFWLLV
jgi:hypothetical protein